MYVKPYIKPSQKWSVWVDAGPQMIGMIGMKLDDRGCQVEPIGPKLERKMAPKWCQVRPKKGPGKARGYLKCIANTEAKKKM